MSKALEHLAGRVSNDPYFLGAVLARYAEVNDFDDPALAGRLQCPVETLTHLRLCRNPDPLPPRFWADVVRIAGKYGVDPDVLAQVVRLGQGLLHARPPTGNSIRDDAGLLLAARDADPQPEGPDTDRGQP